MWSDIISRGSEGVTRVALIRVRFVILLEGYPSRTRTLYHSFFPEYESHTDDQCSALLDILSSGVPIAMSAPLVLEAEMFVGEGILQPIIRELDRMQTRHVHLLPQIAHFYVWIDSA